jgi:P27 family predicted phage terminase small subunit
MPRPGPPPQPAELQALNGNPSHRRKRPPTAQGGFVAADHPPPEYLPKLAQSEWRRQLKNIASMGTLTVPDLGLVEQWAILRADLITMTRQLDKEELIVTDSNGMARRNPLLIARGKANDALLRLSVELGWSPCARTRAVVAYPQKPKAVQ